MYSEEECIFLLLSMNDLREALADVRKGKFEYSCSGSCSCGSIVVPLCKFGIRSESDAFIVAPILDILDDKTKIVIVECTYDKARGLWRPLRLRTDKLTPNSVQTAWATIEAIASSVLPSELIELIRQSHGQERTEENTLSADTIKTLFGSNKNIFCARSSRENVAASSDVEKHYDEIQQSRNKKSIGDERLDILRKVNNW